MKLKVLVLCSFLLCGTCSFATAILNENKVINKSAIINSNVDLSNYNNYSLYRESIEEIENEIAQTPDDFSSLPTLTELYIKSGMYDKSFELLAFANYLNSENKLSKQITDEIISLKNLLSSVIQIEQNKTPIFLNSAIINLIAKDYEKAEKNIMNAISDIDDLIMFENAMNLVFNTTENYEKALFIIDSALKNDLKNTDLLCLKANYLLLMNNQNESRNIYKNVLQIEPYNSVAIYQLFKICQNEYPNDTDLTKKIFSNNTVENYENLIDVLLENDEIEAAKSYAKIRINKYPDSTKNYVTLSEIYFNEGDLQKSYELLKSVRNKIQDNDTIAKYNILLAKMSDEPVKEADVLMQNNLYEQALEVLKSANQNNLYVILSQARANYFVGNKQNSFQLLNKAMTMFPNNADVMCYFGYIFYQEKDYESAKKYLNDALKISPENEYAKNLLTSVNKDLEETYINKIINTYEVGNYTETMNLINEAIKLNSKDSFLYLYKGLTYIALNNYPASTAQFYKAIELDNKNYDAYFYLAVAFDNLSEQENAKMYYQKFVELFPKNDIGDSERLKYALDRINEIAN